MPVAKVYVPEGILTPDQRREIVKGIHDVIVGVEKRPADSPTYVLINEIPARAIVRTMVFLPVVTSSVVVATLWTFLLNQTGLVNSLLATVGIPAQGFLTDGNQALVEPIASGPFAKFGCGRIGGSDLRLRVPRQLGYKSVKYINRLTVTDSMKSFGKGLGSAAPEGGYSWYAGI